MNCELDVIASANPQFQADYPSPLLYLFQNLIGHVLWWDEASGVPGMNSCLLQVLHNRTY